MTARDRIVLLVVAAVALVAGSWMLLIQPKRTQASHLGTQIAALQTQLTTAQTQVSKGLAARDEFASDYTQLARLGEALPQGDNVPSLIYEIQSAATASGVDFRSLQMVPGSSSGSTSPITPSGAAAAANSAAGSSSSSSSSGSSAASAATTLPPGASLGPAGFPTEQFTFEFTGQFFNLSSFFARLDRFVVAGNNTITVSGRLMTINSISLSPGPKGFPQITADVSATTYMAPAGSVTGGASASGPAAGSSTSTGSSAPAPAAATITPTLR